MFLVAERIQGTVEPRIRTAVGSLDRECAGVSSILGMNADSVCLMHFLSAELLPLSVWVPASPHIPTTALQPSSRLFPDLCVHGHIEFFPQYSYHLLEICCLCHLRSF